MQRHHCTQRTSFTKQRPLPFLHPEYTHLILRSFNTQTAPHSQAQGQAPNLCWETTRIHPTRTIFPPRAKQDLSEDKLETSAPAALLQARHAFPLLSCQKGLGLLSVPCKAPHICRFAKGKAAQRRAPAFRQSLTQPQH